MKIELRNISKSYGTILVVQGVSFQIQPNELFFILGPSGCGKTTLLRILAGFCSPDSGDILFQEKRVNDLSPEKRGIPMVFQGYALWPHMTVFENVAYGLRLQKLPEKEIQSRTLQVLETVRMKGYEEHLPNQLSGGQQQRIAIARALAINPSALLFDEPLSNLDAQLRIEMREELLDLHRQYPFTAIYVTHDQEEAMTMATRIAVMEKGEVRQVGMPHEIYRHPKDRFIAEFMGGMNWLPARVKEMKEEERRLLLFLETPVGNWCATQPRNVQTQPGQNLLVGFRPMAARLSPHDQMTGRIYEMVVECDIARVQYTGSMQRLLVKPVLVSKENRELQFQVVEVNPPQRRKEGERLKISLMPEDVMIFPKP